MDLKAGDYPWCVCETNGNQVVFHCQRCDKELSFDNSGIAISRFLEISEAFCMLHKEC